MTFLAPRSSFFSSPLHLSGRVMSLVLNLNEGKPNIFLQEQIRVPTFFISHLVLAEAFTPELRIICVHFSGHNPSILSVSFFFVKHLDQLHVGILSRTSRSIVQVPHLTCLQDETQRQVEDFYNSHCGEQASERCCVL